MYENYGAYKATMRRREQLEPIEVHEYDEIVVRQESSDTFFWCIYAALAAAYLLLVATVLFLV